MKNQLRAIGDFWRQEYGRFVGMTAIAFLVLTVLAYIAGRLFPDIPVTVMSYFNDMIDSSGIVQEDGSFSVLALLGSNVRAMVLSALYGFIPFLYLPALSLGLNAAIIGMLAAMMQGQWLLFAAGILPHGIFELPALVISLACGIYLCSRINQYVRKNTRGIMAPTLKNIVRVLALTVLPLLAVAAAVEAYVTPAVMQFFL